MQRRLALRDATRRPAETALVIAGSLLGTALITGSFIVGDTLTASARATAFTQLGEIDEAVRFPIPRIADGIAAEIERDDEAPIDGVLRVDRVGAAFASRASGRILGEARGQLLTLDFEDGRRFGSSASTTGLE